MIVALKSTILTYVPVKKHTDKPAHGSSFQKTFLRIFFKHILPLQDKARIEEMSTINRNQKNLHLLLEKDGGHIDILKRQESF